MLDLLQENYRESSGPLSPLKYGHIKSAVDPAVAFGRKNRNFCFSGKISWLIDGHVWQGG
jgi:hypothetical protein